MTLRRARPFWAKKKGGGGFEPEYQAVLNRANFLGYTIPDSATNIRNNLRVKYLKDTGIWSDLDLLYMFDQPSGCDEFAKLNYITPSSYELFNSTPSNEPNFIANSGFKGDGSTKYFDTGFNPSIDKVNATDFSSCFFYRGFDFLSDSTPETISTLVNATINNSIVNLKVNASQALFRNQAGGSSFAFPGIDHNLTILASTTNLGARVYKDGTSSNTFIAMSGVGYANGILPLFVAKTTPSTLSNFCKSGLKFFGFGADLGTGSANSNAVNLHEIMTDNYTP